jgi:hypothetical protein
MTDHQRVISFGQVDEGDFVEDRFGEMCPAKTLAFFLTMTSILILR